MIKLLTVLGARPQFVKAASFTRYIQSCPDIDETIVHTGQHYDENMSAVFFSELQLPAPHHQLGVGSGSHATQTAGMLTGIESILLETQPDMVVVYGDTNSTIAGALAAAKLHVPVAHIESGLRSFNRRMPEEINRILTDQISSIHFCPSQSAVDNLSNSGISGDFVVNCGDIMLETQLHYRDSALSVSPTQKTIESSPYILVTFHRAENTDHSSRLMKIVHNLCATSELYRVVIPLHPRTRVALRKMGLLEQLQQHCEVIEPVGFLQMIHLINHSTLVVTDSGGLQKEAFFLDKHCVVMRDETEWLELVELGAARLWHIDSDSNLATNIEQCLRTPITNRAPYGNGNSSELITNTLRKYFNQ